MSIPFPEDEIGYTFEELASITGESTANVVDAINRILSGQTVGVATDGGLLVYVHDAARVMRSFVGKSGCDLSYSDVDELLSRWREERGGR